MEYVKDGRWTTTNPYESFTRTYALLGTNTGSRAFNDIFEQVGKVINVAQSLDAKDDPDKKYLRDDVRMLVETWEEKHPDQSFFPSLNA